MEMYNHGSNINLKSNNQIYFRGVIQFIISLFNLKRIYNGGQVEKNIF